VGNSHFGSSGEETQAMMNHVALLKNSLQIREITLCHILEEIL